MGIDQIQIEYWPAVPFEVKSIEDAGDCYKFNGYASIFDTPDLVNDVVHRGAFKRTMQARGAKGFPIVFMHDRKAVLGKAVMREDERGWFVEDGKLTKGVQLVEDVYKHMKAGVIDGMSFAYRAVKKDYQGKIRNLRELAVSEVTLGPSSMIAHPSALITAVKTLDEWRTDLAAHAEKIRQLANDPNSCYDSRLDTDRLAQLIRDHAHSVKSL